MRGNCPADPRKSLLDAAVEQVCPISLGRCTGDCIFASVMDGERLGVVVFDVEAREVLFVNRSARELLDRLGQAKDFSSLSCLFRVGGGEESAPPVRETEPVKVGSRMLGFTVYRERSFAWVYVRDITEKVRLESIAEAVETMNGIGYVFSAVRHELGNPVNSVKAALSVLRSQVDSFPRETIAEYLDRMAVELGRVEDLLRSLKSFSMFETPAIERVEIASVLEAFGGLVAEEAGRRGICFEVSAPKACPAYCDPRALQQVLLNLFTNAADALEGHRASAILVDASAADGVVTIRHSDNGPGIPVDDQASLFRPFHTTKTHGTGLGLVVSRKLLARMNGTIAVESGEGAGATFVVTLPQPAAAK
jgi:signal transduction histidine kinase